MHSVKTSENSRFNVDPIAGVDYFHDIDFVGDGIRAHRLDVITPRLPNGTAADGTATAAGNSRHACAPQERCPSTCTSMAAAGLPETKPR